MRFVGRLVGWLLLLAALASLGYDLAQTMKGQGFKLSPLGQLWFDLHPGSRNLIQAVIERYLWPPLWDSGMAPLLQWPALPVFLVPGLILAVLCRRPRPRRRWFKS